MPTDPHRVLVGLGTAGDGLPTVIIGLPEEGWKYCQNGKVHTIDLTGAGLPVHIILFGGKDHAELNEWLKVHNALAGDVPDDLPILGEDTDVKPH